MKDRGFKKIRLGIEGYPTTKERVKHRRGKSHVSYNFVQRLVNLEYFNFYKENIYFNKIVSRKQICIILRPFVSLSWEKEEHRSRHVDFQCVKSKSFNQLPVQQIINEHEIDIPPDMVDQVDGIAQLPIRAGDDNDRIDVE